MYETVEYRCADHTALVQLNRPARPNAINPAMVRELRALVEGVRADDSVRLVVFTGHGRAFSAAADISQLVDMSGPPDFLRFIEDIQITYNATEDLGVPTIAALNGLAYGGGCELALACDLRIMAEEATLGMPEIKIGVLPGAGGTQRLAHMLPSAVAKQMIHLGEPLSSADALRHGLVHKVVPAAQLMDEARAWAGEILEKSPTGLEIAKASFNAETDHKRGIGAMGMNALALYYGTDEAMEGRNAFAERRKPDFREYRK